MTDDAGQLGDGDWVTPPEGKLEWVDIDRCVALRRNPQYVTPHTMEALKESIRRDGFVQPVLLRPMENGDFEIVAGNHRVMAARELGLPRVAALIQEFTEEGKQRVAVNTNTIHGDPKAELLAPFLAEMDDRALETVHLSDQILAEVRTLDEELASRLSTLSAPDAWDTSSPQNINDTCDCPKCGRRHIVSQLQ